METSQLDPVQIVIIKTEIDEYEFPRYLLKQYSRLYQDMEQECPDQNIAELNLPNVFQKYTFADFHKIRQFCENPKNSNSEIDQRLLELLSNLRMRKIIFELLSLNAELFKNNITKSDIFSIFMEYEKSFVLLEKIMAIDKTFFAIGKLDLFIDKELETRNSDKLLYMSCHLSKFAIDILDKNFIVPISCTSEDKIKDIEQNDFVQWMQKERNIQFFSSVWSIIPFINKINGILSKFIYDNDTGDIYIEPTTFRNCFTFIPAKECRDIIFQY